jgi:hypothetical protein
VTHLVGCCRAGCLMGEGAGCVMGINGGDRRGVAA